MTGLLEPVEHAVPLGRVGEHDRRVAQRGESLRRRRRAGALPGVRTDVMVVAAGGEEGGLLAELRHEVEAEHVAVEGDRVGDRRHLQVDVAHDRAVGKLLERLRSGSGSSARRLPTSSGSVVIRSKTCPSQTSRGRSQ